MTKIILNPVHLLTCVVCAFFTLQANAASIPLNFTVEATSVDAGITAIVVGDQFQASLVVDDSVIDTNTAAGVGTFPSLLTSYTFAALPGNAGTWSPTAGTADIPASNFVTNAFGDNITFQVIGTGFPMGGAGLQFQDFDHGFQWPTDLTDSGVGDTFAEQLGVPFGVPPATMNFEIRFTDGADFPVVSFEVTIDNGPIPPNAGPAVPTLSRFSLIFLALFLVLIGWRRASKAQ